MLTPDESADLYRGARERVTDAARGLTDAQLDTVVPACPQWTVRDLLSHQAGIAHDFVDGNLDGAPSDRWTAVHVDTRRGSSVADVLAEWDEYGGQLEEIVRAGSRRGRLLNNPYVDAGTHEADLHGAVGLGRPPREIWLAVLDFAVSRARGDEPGVLTVTTGDASYELGSGGPAATATADTYELFRATFGRRSPHQIRSWSWTGDAEAWSRALPKLPQTGSDLTD